MYQIVIDTREQNPFLFSDKIETVAGTIPLGDYTIRGLEDRIAIERKSLSDLLGSMTNDRPRFVRELKGLRRYAFAALVIETNWDTIRSGRYRSRMSAASALASLISFVVKYGIVPVLADNHEIGAAVTEGLLVQYAKQIDAAHKAMHAHEKKGAVKAWLRRAK